MKTWQKPEMESTNRNEGEGRENGTGESLVD